MVFRLQTGPGVCDQATKAVWHFGRRAPSFSAQSKRYRARNPGAATTTRRPQAETFSAAAKPARQVFLYHPPSILVPVGRRFGNRAARDRGRLASRRLSLVLALALPAAWRSAQDRRGDSGPDPPFG